MGDVQGGGKCSGGEDAPEGTDGVNGDAAGGVIDLVPQINVNGSQGHDESGDSADEDRPGAKGDVGRRGDGHKRGQETDDHEVHVGFAIAKVAQQQAGRPACGGGEENVEAGSDQVIEGAGHGHSQDGGDPADEHEQCANGGEGNAVAGNAVGGAVAVVFSIARADDHGGDEGSEAAGEMDDRCAAEVDIAEFIEP